MYEVCFETFSVGGKSFPLVTNLEEKEPEPEIEVIKEEEPEIKVKASKEKQIVANLDFLNGQVIDPKKSPFLSPPTPYLVISFDVKLTDSCWASEIYQVAKVLFPC